MYSSYKQIFNQNEALHNEGNNGKLNRVQNSNIRRSNYKIAIAKGLIDHCNSVTLCKTIEATTYKRHFFKWFKVYFLCANCELNYAN